MQCNEVINQQVNDAISQVAAFVENVLPKKDSDTTFALARVASTASEKMMINFSALMDTQSRDDIPSNNEEDARTDERSTEESDVIYDWDVVVQQITADPSLAEVDVEGILPLHALCGAGAPLGVIKMLLEIYPEAAQAKCGKGYLPIVYYLALNKESPSEDIVSVLLESFPGAAAVVDPNNQLPIHHACKATGVSEKIFSMLLRAHPDGAYACDLEGKYPVDYANANEDAATRKAALASLTAGDVELMLARSRSTASVMSVLTIEPSKSVHDIVVPVSRSGSNAMSQASKTSPQDVKVPVARSSSDASAKSQASKMSSKSAQDVEVPVARSHSNTSTKSQASNKSSKSIRFIFRCASSSFL